MRLNISGKMGTTANFTSLRFRNNGPKALFSPSLSYTHTQSELVRLNLTGNQKIFLPSTFSRIRNIGTKAHGLVSWRGSFLVLDSEAAALVQVDRENGSSEAAADLAEAAGRRPQVLWKVGGKSGLCEEAHAREAAALVKVDQSSGLPGTALEGGSRQKVMSAVEGEW